MHLRIQRMAVGSPVGAEVEQNILPASSRVSNGCGNVVMRISLFVKKGRSGRLLGGAKEK
jgi:hypothetical protein